MTVAADRASLNISYEGLLLMVSMILRKKVASSEKLTQLKTRVLKPYPIKTKNGQNWYPPIYDQNGWKTLYKEYASPLPPRSTV